MKLNLDNSSGALVPISIEVDNEEEVRFLLDQLRPKGEWNVVEPNQEDINDGISYREECSVCHEPNRHFRFNKYSEIEETSYYRTPFCPNCGADMRGGKE